MIIVEGPDGAGKTTLIEMLSKNLDLLVAPRVVSKDAEAMVDLREWVDQNLDKGFQHTIFDRHRLVSEPIYGPILRENQEPGFDQLSWLAPRMKRFYDIKPILIYCLPPLSVVLANVMDDPDNSSVQHAIRGIYSAYVARAAIDLEMHPDNTFLWDYARTLQVNGKPSWFHRLESKITFTNFDGVEA